MGQEKTQSIYKQLIGLLFCDLKWGWFKLFGGSGYANLTFSIRGVFNPFINCVGVVLNISKVSTI